ncbi:hypothetical protein OTU49_017411, partial [Cherax quadricarinatus]
GVCRECPIIVTTSAINTGAATSSAPLPPQHHFEQHHKHAHIKDYTTEDLEDASFVLSALVAAVEEGNLPGLEKLFNVAQNIDVNMANKHGESAIHLSCGLGQLEALRFLVKKGGSLDATDAQGDTPLHWAARQGHAHVIAYLIEQGAQINT